MEQLAMRGSLDALLGNVAEEIISGVCDRHGYQLDETNL